MKERDLLADVIALRDRLVGAGDVGGEVHPRHRASAQNLAHFLALRSEDLRDLQDRLAAVGVSSLGRCEPHVMATVDSVITLLSALSGSAPEPLVDRGDAPDYRDGAALVAANADALLGPEPASRATRIMVTLPSEAAHDPDLVERFVKCGMDVARINCAHDDVAAWTAMAGHARAAAANVGRQVRVLMDLAGPKLRTGPIASGPAVLKLRPDRDALGRVRAPARAWLVPTDRPAEPSGLPRIALSGTLLDLLAAGDELHLTDAREARRTLRVSELRDGAAIVETTSTIYLTNGVVLHHTDGEAVVSDVPPTRGSLRLNEGDALVLTADLIPADLTRTDEATRLGCTLPEAFAALRPGHRVFLDDGKFAGVVELVDDGEAYVRITDAPAGGARLRAEKGINLPDTELPVSALTTKDHDDLGAVVELADVVGLSFVRQASDVDALQRRLAQLDATHLGVVLKIETTQGFRNLPDLVRTAMRSPHVGVMIARGDLAVEAGYQRLAEVQEEILWLCEAAHLPVIWATEVLDRLARTGRPSRSEITDAAMSERAECVMLNKGPHVSEAITVLDDILVRMAAHQHKKRPLLRQLRSWSEAVAVPDR